MILAAPWPLRASLLVYEGFQYSSGATLNSITPNAQTVGLSTSTAYAGTGVGGYTVTASSLAFGSLVTSGGAVSFSAATNVAAARLSLAAPFTGTLYTTHLIQLTSRGPATADGFHSRASNDTTTGGQRFFVLADSRQSSTNVGTSYAGAVGTHTNATTGLTLGTNYLMIGRFTNVGTSIGIGGGTATAYALDLAQFNSFMLAGGLESYLDTTAIGTAANQITARVSAPNALAGTYGFATGQFVHFVNVNDIGIADEFRYGSALASVIPVPEPTAFGMLLAGLAGLAYRRFARLAARH
jgi:hypothetical protein